MSRTPESPAVHIAAVHTSHAAVLTMTGTLDSSTYLSVRDSVIKAALDEPAAVIVDVSDLTAPAVSAWSVFASARWHVSTWPDVPVALVCAGARGRDAITASGITRYVGVHADRAAALRAVGDTSLTRRRARAELLAARSAVARARELIGHWLTLWGCPEMIPTAATVATVFVENVLEHTVSNPVVAVEAIDGYVTVAVSDRNWHPATRHEDPAHGAELVSGLAIVAALTRTWGSSPTPDGKTVWAVMGPENRL